MAVMVLGNAVYFLALLIICFRWNTSQKVSYALRNFCMAMSLLVAMGLGSVYHIPAMGNTAKTFAVLWLMAKPAEIEGINDLWIILMFGWFASLYFGAHFLHSHPGFIVSLVDGSWMC